MITSIADNYLAEFVELTKDIDFEDEMTRTSYNRFTNLDDPENFGSASVAFMRIHLVLAEMMPLIELLNELGSDSPFVHMYKAMTEVQKNITHDQMQEILKEAKDHAGITEG